jgi:catechol 2,3-dioxygenase-like lactoylglutathione lyase family enzyme
MPQHLMHMALLVREYDEAIAWFTNVLGFSLLEDSPQTPEKRWVRVAPPGSTESELLLARAANDSQRAFVGKQGGGRDYHAMQSRGVKFCEAPRDEEYGTVVVFEDLYGNRWDLVQMLKFSEPR